MSAAAVTGVPPLLRVSNECVLCGATSSLRAALKAALTIDNPKYQAAKQFGRWIGKQLKPQLFFYREEGDALVFPRGFGNQAVLLCRQHQGVSPVIDDQRRQLPEIEVAFTGELRPYQQQAVRAVLGHSFGVLEAGTGSGKTIMALAIIAAFGNTKLNLTVARLPLTEMDDLGGDEPEIRPEFHRSLRFWMLYRAYSKKDRETEDPEKAQANLALFEAEFGPRSSALAEEQRRMQQVYERYVGTGT